MRYRSSLAVRAGFAVVAAVAAGLVAGADGQRGRPRGRRPDRLPAAVMTAPASPVMKVAPIDRGRRPAVAAAAAAIDAILANHWKAHGVEPAPRLTDEQFVRRAFLAIGGRIPSLDEAASFLESREPGKRAALIDTLLESPDFVSHTYNFWADILRLAERLQKGLPFEPYLFYVKESIQTNKPYDAWVREMLTADGRLWENPAVGYQLRDAGMPLPYVDNTVRVFLGTQIGCAQCHDHPFDDWTQRQFYELAAFTAGTRMRAGDVVKVMKNGRERQRPDPTVTSLIRQAKTALEGKAGPVVNFIQTEATAVAYTQRRLTLPRDYQYDDAEPLSRVTPRVLWGEVPPSAAGADGREQFAAWLTSRDNRQFARTIANRMWKRAMGVGLVEPVDDFREENPASAPELLEHLTDLMLATGFDLREFLRVVMATDAWQRRAVAYDPTSGAPFRFPGPALRRMTAEQLWDSILVLVARNPWAVQRPTTAEIAAVMEMDLQTATLDDVQRAFAAASERFGAGQYRRMLLSTCGYRGQLIMRASEMPTPLPLAHFLRQFGQSDRESIEGGRTVATIPQILAMFNGPITHAMLEPGSVVHGNVTSRRPDETIDVIFLSVLSRRPSAEDRRLVTEEILAADDRAVGCGNAVWALLNTREFLFIQ